MRYLVDTERGARKNKGLKVRAGIRAGGIDVNHTRTALAVRAGRPRINPTSRALAAAHFEHRRLIAAADRLLAAGDVQIARCERVIERVRRELAAS